jgi:type 1 fimbria pilin
MRNFNMLAAVAAALLMGTGISAKEKTDQPKPRKVCRTVQMSGRVTPQRICRIVPPSDTSAEDNRRKAGDAPQAGNDRD